MCRGVKTKSCPKCKGSGRVPDLRSVGAVLRRLREKSGMTVAELAQRMAVTPEYVYMIETGKRNAGTEIQFNYFAICRGEPNHSRKRK